MRVALAAAVAVAAAPAAAARAAPPITALADWADPDAAVVLVVQPDALARGFQLAGDLGADSVAGWPAAVREALGADVLDAAAWSKLGLDAGAPVVVSLGAIDGAEALAVYDALIAADKWNDKTLRTVRKTMWRHRAVIPLADARRATAAVKAMAAAAPGLYAVDVAADAPDIAMLLGAVPRKAPGVVSPLRKRGVEAIGWLPGLDAVIAVRVDARRKVVVVDVISSFAGVPLVWARNQKQIVGALDRHRGGSGVRARLSAGGAAGLGGADVIAWIQPGPLLDAAIATGRHNVLRAVAEVAGARERKTIAREGGAAVERCELFRPFATAGAFSDAAIGLWLDARTPRVAVAWGLRRGDPLAAALAARDDGAVDLAGLGAPVFVFASYLDGVGALRALPRPPALDGGVRALAETAATCGSGGALVTALFGWPAVAGAVLDRIAGAEPGAEPAVAGARNVVVAVKDPPADGGARPDVAAVVSFDGAGGAAIDALIERVAGAPTAGKLGGRAVSQWKVLSGRAVSFGLLGDRRAAGAGTDEAVLAWLVAARGKPGPSKVIARWTADLARLGAAELGVVRGELRLAGGVLSATFSFELP